MWEGRRQATAWIDGKKADLSYVNPIPWRERQNRLRTLLGAEGFAAYNKSDWHREILGPRSTALRLATGLCFTDTPLTSPQADQLAQIIFANTRMAPDKTPVADWDAIDAKVQRVLSAAQLPAWETELAARRVHQAKLWAQAVSPNPTPAK